MRRLLAALLFVSAPAFAGQVSPPPPLPAPVCGGGNSIVGYTVAGTPLVCGTALASGSIVNGAVGQVGVYSGLNAISPLANVTDSVLVRAGISNPGFSQTLPSGLTIPGYALLASPVFTGDPHAPTPATADNDTSIATTAFVKAQGYAVGGAISGVTSGELAVAGPGNTIVSSLPVGLTGSATVVKTNVGGTIDASLIGAATITNTQLRAGAAAANLGFTPAANTVSITASPPLAGGGDLTANRVLSLAGPANLTTFPANAIPKGTDASPFIPSSIIDTGSGVTIGSATGGALGPGTLNVGAGIFIAGAPVGSGGGGNISGLVAGQLGIAGSPTALTSSVPFGTSGASTILQTASDGTIAASVIPNTTVVPGGCTSCDLTIGADGRVTLKSNGVGGLNQLVGDVTAGPGLGSQSATVAGLQGRPVSPATPADQDVIAWNQSTLRWEPLHTPLNALNQLTGDGTAGPGSGSQALTLAAVLGSPGTFVAATYDAKGRAIATANLSGDVTSSGATATLVPTGVVPGSYNVTGAGGAPYCWAIDAKGRISGVTAGTCAGLVLALATGNHVALVTGTLTAIRMQ